MFKIIVFLYVIKLIILCFLFILYVIYVIFFMIGRLGFLLIGGNFGGKFDYFY